MHLDTSDQDKGSEVKINVFAMKCYSHELLFGYSCSEAPAAGSFSISLANSKDGKQTPDVQGLDTHSTPQSEINSSSVNAFRFSIRKRTWNNSLATGMFQEGIFLFLFTSTSLKYFPKLQGTSSFPGITTFFSI